MYMKGFVLANIQVQVSVSISVSVKRLCLVWGRGRLSHVQDAACYFIGLSSREIGKKSGCRLSHTVYAAERGSNSTHPHVIATRGAVCACAFVKGVPCRGHGSKDIY